MKKIILLTAWMALQITTNQAYAIDILCSKKPKSVAEINYEKEGGGFAVAGESTVGDITLNELFDQFSRGASIKSNQPILFCLLPQTNPSTIELFDLLGIDNRVINTFFNERRIITRRTQLVRSDEEMLSCVASAYPSIGYLASTPAKNESLKCF